MLTNKGENMKMVEESKKHDIVMTQQHLKNECLLCVLYLLESGNDWMIRERVWDVLEDETHFFTKFTCGEWLHGESSCEDD
ncbi:hypothetical protein Tco_0041390 [Tanacetum coccineum]